MSAAACCTVLAPCCPCICSPQTACQRRQFALGGNWSFRVIPARVGPWLPLRVAALQLALGAHRVSLGHLPVNAPAAEEGLLHVVHQQKVFLIGEMFQHKDERMHGALLVRRGLGPMLCMLSMLAHHWRRCGGGRLPALTSAHTNSCSANQLQLAGGLRHSSSSLRAPWLACSRSWPCLRHALLTK